MKKNFTILSALLITLFSLNVKAQDDAPVAKSYMAFLGGLSLPLGDFANSAYSNNNAGFAKKGPVFDLDFGIYVHKNLAIGITASYQDQGELNATDVQNLANGYNASFIKDQTSVTALGRYSSFNLMVGPQYSFLYKSFTLDLRADAGGLKSFGTPSLTTVFDYSSNSGNTYYQPSSQSFTLAYGGSIGLRYSLGDSWDVGVRLNYIQSNGLKIENTGGDPGSVGRFQTHQPVSMLQSTLGITLKF
jgi:Outer membrane protein beta-barrel domain